MELPSALTERPSKDCKAFNCPISALRQTMAELHNQYPVLADLTAVDHGGEDELYFQFSSVHSRQSEGSELSRPDEVVR